ncbi:hypothetical protein P22_0780 [Propionispora sp. 2/2-37]|uniref:MarR family winged helix-turn-helix transcriptional regulator n=1 Tax=Propionispora sp. 2/2-37 TaxID=1677858 RepID=UPI0006BB8BAF|nr:MarR family transcriptional regulator [Propionispora sp. 2/2-37]CUH94714.1 hypothetical protein P22_0780 [Propionispora sp. 2/2-37]
MAAEDVIVKAIGILSESMRECMRKYKEETPNSKELFNLSITQLHYLHAIRERTNPTITELAEGFGVQRSTVTVAVNKLMQSGLIEKFPSENDLRVVYVRLSDKGKQIIDVEDEGYYHFASYITATLNERERETLALLLKKVLENIARN